MPRLVLWREVGNERIPRDVDVLQLHVLPGFLELLWVSGSSVPKSSMCGSVDMWGIWGHA